MIDKAAFFMAAGNPFACERISGVNDNMVRSHYHEFFEIYYLEQGRRQHIIEDNQYILQPDEFIIFPPFVMHHSFEENDIPFQRLLLYFSPEAIHSAQILRTLSERSRVYKLPRAQSHSIYQLMQNILEEQERGDLYSRELITLQLNQLAVLLVRNSAEAARPEQRNRLTDIINYLHEHYTEDISLEQLANHFYISQYHLCREFKRYTSSTIIQYIHNLRVLHAQRLLQESDYSITEISKRVGFSNVTHFNRVYKSVTGMSPSQNKQAYLNRGKVADLGMLESIHEDMTVGDLCQLPVLKTFSPYLFTHMSEDMWSRKLSQLGLEKCGISAALSAFCQAERAGTFQIFDVYGKAVTDRDPEKAQVKLLYLAGKAGMPFALVCPGGGYNRQWTLVEGFPIAWQLSQMGYHAFILLYRSGKTGLLPEPLEDTAQALQLIASLSDSCRFTTRNYAVCGFSAGGNLAALWGTKTQGYARYDAPRPAALLLAYPSVTHEVMFDAMQTSDDEAWRSGTCQYLARVAGSNFTRESLADFSPTEQLDPDYPPVYLMHCLDDATVPVQSSRVFDNALQARGIVHRSRFPAHGGHGIGLGIGTDAEGWLGQAVQFWQEQCGKA